jgi:hypothetical protein
MAYLLAGIATTGNEANPRRLKELHIVGSVKDGEVSNPEKWQCTPLAKETPNGDATYLLFPRAFPWCRLRRERTEPVLEVVPRNNFQFVGCQNSSGQTARIGRNRMTKVARALLSEHAARGQAFSSQGWRLSMQLARLGKELPSRDHLTHSFPAFASFAFCHRQPISTRSCYIISKSRKWPHPFTSSLAPWTRFSPCLSAFRQLH